MRALQECRAILRVTMARRIDRAIKIMGLMGLLLTLGAIVVAGIMIWRHQMGVGLGLRMLAGVAALWLTLAWAVVFVPRSIMLNSAVNARMMPRQRRRLMQMVAAGWLLTTGLFTALSGHWTLFPLAGMLMLGLAMTLSGIVAGVALIILPGNWPLASQLLLPRAWVEALTGAVGLPALSALVLLGAVLALRRMFPAGGDAHLGKFSRQIERLQHARGGDWTQNLESGTVSGASVLRFYAAALRRDCARGSHADPGKMLMHALGPAANWTFWIASVAIVLAIGIGLHFIMARYAGEKVFASLVFGSMSGMVVVILMSTGQLVRAIDRTQGEQALLRLAPLAGDQRLLNRRLATLLLRHALLVWTMLTAVILLVSFLVVGSGNGLIYLAGLCCLAGQVALTGVLGNYAGDDRRSLARMLLAGLLALFEAGVALGAGRLIHASFGWWMIAIAVVVTALQLRHGWCRMLAAPPAFPARRLALS
jgi:hypothetical protein